MLVAAVLRPEQREDGELEMVRLALQQLEDAVVLPVREAELAVEWLFRDEAQDASLERRLLMTLARGAGRLPHIRATSGDYPPRAVSRRDALLLLLLSAIWGSSFLFIKLGVDVLEPSVVVLGRLVFGALFLLVLLPGRGGLDAASWARASPPRARSAQQRAPVLAARIRRAPPRLRPDGRDPGRGTDLHRPPRRTHRRQPTGDGIAPDRSRDRVPRRGAARRRAERRQPRRGDRGDRRRALLRDLRPLRGTDRQRRCRRSRSRSDSSPAPR